MSQSQPANANFSLHFPCIPHPAPRILYLDRWAIRQLR